MKKVITLALALISVGTLSAQQDKGGITEGMGNNPSLLWVTEM